ncbi:BREX-4 system phosphatase PglZ [Coprothermobacter platensis]|uniref:BREX-4 system phosphatase PglZ n=1 Tax=Coprothermobacter platensis TaxID=108819 RepID=UPI00037D78A6|nr:BREX-4 system phosphatase PglZ [Coprothermobacter platensis]
MNVNSMESLIELIDEDKSDNTPSATRYPVRFIFTKSVWAVNDITMLLKLRELDILDASELFPLNTFSDGFPSLSTILQAIREKKDDVVVVSLGNLVRFWPDEDFYSLMMGLMEIENSPQKPDRRIYVILEGLIERFDSVFWSRRTRQIGSDPRWTLESPRDKVQVYLIKFDYTIDDSNALPDVKSLMKLWEKSKSDEFICFSKTLRPKSCFCSDDVVSVNNVLTQKDFLQKVMFIDVHEIPYDEKDSEHWTMLIKEFEKINVVTLKALIESKYNLKDAYHADWAEVFAAKAGNDFERWLIKNFVINSPQLNSSAFISVVFRSMQSTTTEEFIEKSWMLPFERNLTKEQLVQRRELLSALHNVLGKTIPPEVNNTIQKEFEVLDTEKVGAIVTGIAPAEKHWLVRNYEKLMRELSVVYPELDHYLSNINVISDSQFKDILVTYIQEYKKCRLKNEITDELRNILDKLNKNEASFYSWYYSLPTATQLAQGIDRSMLRWIDGLGMEFASLVCNKLESMGYKIEVHLSRANLPTATSFNMFEGVDRIDSLDNYIHRENTYKYPENFVMELEIIANEILPMLTSSKRDFCIVADHGFTALAGNKFQKINKFKFEKVHHEGRFAELDSNQELPHDEDVVVYQDTGSKRVYALALKHVSFGVIPRRESHGGATPEEVLIPVIFAHIAAKTKYEVKLESATISVRRRVFRFRIKPEPKSVPHVTVGNTRYEVSKDGDWFEIKLSNIKSGNYTAKITLPGFEQEVEFAVKGGIEERGL